MKKIVYAVLAIIIVIGIIVVATIGFNVDTIYSNHREEMCIRDSITCWNRNF